MEPGIQRSLDEPRMTRNTPAPRRSRSIGSVCSSTNRFRAVLHLFGTFPETFGGAPIRFGKSRFPYNLALFSYEYKL